MVRSRGEGQNSPGGMGHGLPPKMGRRAESPKTASF